MQQRKPANEEQTGAKDSLDAATDAIPAAAPKPTENPEGFAATHNTTMNQASGLTEQKPDQLVLSDDVEMDNAPTTEPEAKDETMPTARAVSSPLAAVPAAVAPVAAAAVPPAVLRGAYTTPGPQKKVVQTPASRPSSSRNHAALVDGQFHPTPMETPATETGNQQLSRPAAIPFGSPPPRTVFANKKAKRMEGESTLVADIAPPATAATAAAGVAPTAHAGSIPSSSKAHAMGPPVPAVRSKGERSTGMTRPAPRPRLPISPDGAKQAQQGAEKPKKANAPMKEIHLNVARYGKGPVIRRPAACPPLFKSAEGRRPLPPPPPPSAQKTSAAAAISGNFFNQERTLISMLSNGGMTTRPAPYVGGAQQQRNQQKVPQQCAVSASPVVAVYGQQQAGNGPSPQLGSALGWAFSQLRQQQR